MMQFAQPEDTAAQLIITKERLQVCPNRFDQSVVNPRRDVILEKRRLQRGGIMARPCTENIGFHRIGERRCQRELVILKFAIKLMERAFAYFMIALHQKRAERTLTERAFLALLVEQRAEFHVDVGELRKGVVVAIKRGAAEREQALLRLREHMRF